MGLQISLHESSPKNNLFLFSPARTRPRAHFFHGQGGSREEEISKLGGGKDSQKFTTPFLRRGRRLKFSGAGEAGNGKRAGRRNPRAELLSTRRSEVQFLCRVLLPGCGRTRTPGVSEGSPYRSFQAENFSTKMMITTARIRRMIKPPYIRKFRNFFPKLVFPFGFSWVAVSCTGLGVCSMGPSFLVSDRLFTYYIIKFPSRGKYARRIRRLTRALG
jgi:hypothetical protein